jgi:hypothetical protein
LWPQHIIGESTGKLRDQRGLHRPAATAKEAAPIGPKRRLRDVCFSNRLFEVKRSQTIRRCNVDVAHGLALLFGIGTRALPSWDTRTR